MQLVQISVEIVLVRLAHDLVNLAYYSAAVVRQIQVFFGYFGTVKQLVEERSHVAVVSLFPCLKLDVICAKEKLQASTVRHSLLVDQIVEIVFKDF